MKLEKTAIPYIGAVTVLSCLIAVYLANEHDKVERLEELIQVLLEFFYDAS